MAESAQCGTYCGRAADLGEGGEIFFEGHTFKSPSAFSVYGAAPSLRTTWPRMTLVDVKKQSRARNVGRCRWAWGGRIPLQSFQGRVRGFVDVLDASARLAESIQANDLRG